VESRCGQIPRKLFRLRRNLHASSREDDEPARPDYIRRRNTRAARAAGPDQRGGSAASFSACGAGSGSGREACDPNRCGNLETHRAQGGRGQGDRVLDAGGAPPSRRRLSDALGSAGIGLEEVSTGVAGPANLPTTASNIAIMQPGSTMTFLRQGSDIPSDFNQFNPGSAGTPTPATTALPGSLNQSNSLDPNQISPLPSAISWKP
jgi:hypothetical protein